MSNSQKNQTVREKRLPWYRYTNSNETILKQIGWEDIKLIRLATNRDCYVLVNKVNELWGQG
jgi:hypothetical protein